MSLTLLFICRRSVNLTQVRPLLFRPLQFSPRILHVEFSTLKSKYGSIKPSSSPYQNPFREPVDDKSRRLTLQEQIRFREKFQLENDYELVYAMPRQRMYSLMHFLCTCASVTMLVFVVMQFHRDMLDMEPILSDINQEMPLWTLYSVATVVGSAFGIILVLISRMPVRLYYSSVRHSYALFYHPIIGVFRQKKILFGNNQYQIIPQKLDNIDTPQRSMQIRIEEGQGLLRMKSNFYLIEDLFRSKRDVQRIRTHDIETEETSQKEHRTEEEETDIWETVVEKKDQGNINPKPPQRRTFK